MEGWQCVICAAGGGDKKAQGRYKGNGVFLMTDGQWKLERVQTECEAQPSCVGMCRDSILFQRLPIHLVSEQVCVSALTISIIFLSQKQHRLKTPVPQVFPFHNTDLFGHRADSLAKILRRFKQLFIYCTCQTTT